MTNTNENGGAGTSRAAVFGEKTLLLKENAKASGYLPASL
jgi:hypothetical protein